MKRGERGKNARSCGVQKNSVSDKLHYVPAHTEQERFTPGRDRIDDLQRVLITSTNTNTNANANTNASTNRSFGGRGRPELRLFWFPLF